MQVAAERTKEGFAKEHDLDLVEGEDGHAQHKRQKTDEAAAGDSAFSVIQSHIKQVQADLSSLLLMLDEERQRFDLAHPGPRSDDAIKKRKEDEECQKAYVPVPTHYDAELIDRPVWKPSGRKSRSHLLQTLQLFPLTAPRRRKSGSRSMNRPS